MAALVIGMIELLQILADKLDLVVVLGIHWFDRI
ncbi:hypothetical protein ACVPOQ_08165 [Staphylococcus aureus]